jgi:zinc transporter, ZIP family
MGMAALLLTTVTFFSTLAGGLFALHFHDHLHLLLGFSAGVLIGVAFLDVLPEALELGDASGVPVTTILLVLLAGILCAGGFSFHSFLDGAAIGIGFQASAQIGLLIALAVLVHDFSDVPLPYCLCSRTISNLRE